MVLFVDPTSFTLVPDVFKISNILKLSPISIISPLESSKFFPLQKVLEIRSRAAALLFTKTASSEPISNSNNLAIAIFLSVLFPVFMSYSTFIYELDTSMAFSMTFREIGALPILVWRIIPVALISLVYLFSILYIFSLSLK